MGRVVRRLLSENSRLRLAVEEHSIVAVSRPHESCESRYAACSDTVKTVGHALADPWRMASLLVCESSSEVKLQAVLSHHPECTHQPCVFAFAGEITDHLRFCILMRLELEQIVTARGVPRFARFVRTRNGVD